MGFGVVIRFIDHFNITCDYTSQFTVTDTLVLSVYYISNSRCLLTDPPDGDSSFSVLMSLLLGKYPATELASTDFFPTELSHLPTKYFTSLHSTELHSASLGPLLYRFRRETTENSPQKSFYCQQYKDVISTGMCLLTATKQCMFLLAIAAQQCYNII